MSLPQLGTVTLLFPPSLRVSSLLFSQGRSRSGAGKPQCVHTAGPVACVTPRNGARWAPAAPLLQMGRPRQRAPGAVTWSRIRGRACPTPRQEPLPGLLALAHTPSRLLKPRPGHRAPWVHGGPRASQASAPATALEGALPASARPAAVREPKCASPLLWPAAPSIICGVIPGAAPPGHILFMDDTPIPA